MDLFFTKLDMLVGIQESKIKKSLEFGTIDRYRLPDSLSLGYKEYSF